MRAEDVFLKNITITAMIPQGLARKFCSATAITIHSEMSFRGPVDSLKRSWE